MRDFGASDREIGTGAILLDLKPDKIALRRGSFMNARACVSHERIEPDSDFLQAVDTHLCQRRRKKSAGGAQGDLAPCGSKVGLCPTQFRIRPGSAGSQLVDRREW